MQNNAKQLKKIDKTIDFLLYIVYNSIVKGGIKMIIKIQTKKSYLCWNSQKCKPLQFVLGLSWLFIPIAAMAIAQTITGAEVMF